MATELFAANRATTTVSSGGTDAPAGGTQETWTVASSAMFGAAATGVSQFHVADPLAPTEMIAVINVSGTTWTVTRGAESTTPVAHAPGFTVYQVTTTGFLSSLSSGLPSAILTTSGDILYENATPAPARLAGNTSATIGFLTQTGTGSASAAPAWTLRQTALNALAGTQTTGYVLGSDGTNVSMTPDGGVTVKVPAPTGLTATDTPNVTAAITRLATALGSGPATLLFQDGTYQIDSNSAVIQSVSNFTVKGSGGTVIAQAPNRSGLVNNTRGDLFVIADCTDFTVTGLTFDGKRDTVSPIAAVTAAITSGQPSVTIAAGAAAAYNAGQVMNLYGGLGSGEQAQSQAVTVSSVTPGGGSGGGDLVTFTGNITSNYNTVNGAILSDAFGPYGSAGAYLSYYQPSGSSTVAGRALSNEDQQNGLHLLNCQRFLITGITSRNLWESPVKLGAGISAQANTYANSCYNGIVAGCRCYHGYDQGVSVWISQYITITGNYIDSPGWAGVSLTQSDFCAVTANEIKNVIYFGAGQAGGGVAVEGGIRNEITANVITAPSGSTVAGGITIQGWNSNAKWGLSSTSSSWPTLSAFVEQGTAAGTSIQISATTGMLAGGRYSIFDGYRTESVTAVSIVDGTHITFGETLRFSHASGLYISPRISQDNTVAGNTIDLAGASASAHGINSHGSVRSAIQGNLISNWTNNGIDLNANTQFCPPGSSICGDGSQVLGNTLAGGANQPLPASGVTHLLISGNKIYGTPQSGSNRGIALGGVTDSVVSGNNVSDIVGSDAIRLTTGGPSSAACARVAVAGNVIERSDGAGISAVLADSCTFTGNICNSNVTWGISLTGSTNCLVDGNTCNSNKSGGITLANNSSTGCSNCRVTGNTTREDSSGVNVTSGATFTQPHGIVESGNSNGNLFLGNECDANTSDQLTTVGAGTYAFANTLSGTISGAVPAALISQLADYAPTGLTGATAASRYAGATASGAPVSGTFAVGDFVVDETGGFWICTTAGTPGTWTQCSGSGGALTNPMTTLGDTIYGGSAGAATRLAGSTSATPQVLGQTGTGSASTAPAWVTSLAAGLFGDGSDSTATLDGVATASWASKASSVYTMTRDAFLTSLTVNGGVTLNTAGFRIFCAGTVTNSGTIQNNGANAASATGASSSTGSLTGNGGGNGTTGAGSAGGSTGTRFGVGTSGGGGTGSNGSGGGGTGQRTTTTPHRSPAVVLAGVGAWSGAAQPASGAPGGGGGAGDNSNSGGGGGAGGGLIAILAWAVNNSGGTISANGGNGFTPVSGNCGGGGAGGGGLILIYSLTAWTAGTTSVTAGTPGAGVGSGTNGGTGTSGSVLNVVVQ